MTAIPFSKYQATGNDFIIVDNRGGEYRFSDEQITQMCDRRFGIGADGLMLIENHAEFNFNLVYYNSDGSQSLCGNGSRAAVAMASDVGIIRSEARFLAYDGVHDATINSDGAIQLQMNPVKDYHQTDQCYVINTGSPHAIIFVDDVHTVNVLEEGHKIRFSKDFAPQGINVNFVTIKNHHAMEVRTYERGVENETYSCGTGVTGAALVAIGQKLCQSPVEVQTKGGLLTVACVQEGNAFHKVCLSGPACFVFKGVWNQ